MFLKAHKPKIASLLGRLVNRMAYRMWAGMTADLRFVCAAGCDDYMASKQLPFVENQPV